MNPKIKITHYIAEQLGLGTDDTAIRKLKRVFWRNTRDKVVGGLRLTEQGFESLSKTDLKSYAVKFVEPVQYTNQLIIHLDNFITCPWYVTNKAIHVFDDKIAIQLVLFSGDIAKFSTAKAKSLKKA